jgi:hypothetical protein
MPRRIGKDRKRKEMKSRNRRKRWRKARGKLRN